MFPQKFVKDGKKYIKFRVGEKEIEAELAPIELVRRIASVYKVEKVIGGGISVQKEVKVNEPCKFNGHVTLDTPGKYRLEIHVIDDQTQTDLGHFKSGVFEVYEETEIVTYSEIKQRIEEIFGDRQKNCDYHFEDEKYYRANVDALVQQIKNYGIPEIGYEYPWFDCGDFSFAAMGVWHLNRDLARQACFIAWVYWEQQGKIYAHALNAAFDTDFKFIEPQTAEVFAPPENWNLIVLMG
ncbi:hypothetical protein DRP04_00845 [Archaeoglobales archaeon]|nr:MAG: hypothetical protein DRP04_00845 [Archaeoglobales archaeon]